MESGISVGVVASIAAIVVFFAGASSAGGAPSLGWLLLFGAATGIYLIAIAMTATKVIEQIKQGQ